MAKLVVPITFKIQIGDGSVRTETIAQNVIKIGRDQKSHLRIEDDSVSRMHAVIEAKAEGIQIIDLGSGTSVNGQSVNKCDLNTGDEIKLGKAKITVEIGKAVEATEAKPKAASMPPPAQEGASAAASTPPLAAAVAPTAPAIPAAAPLPSFAANPLVSGAPHAAAHTPAAHGPGAHPSVDGEEIYQLIKRGDINPREVEDAGVHAVEVSVLWKTAIMHVAHLDGTKDFVLSNDRGKSTPAGTALAVGMGIGAALISGAIATGSGAVGAMGTLAMLGGAGAAIGLDQKEVDRQVDVARFVVGEEMLTGVRDLPIVLNRGGRTRFVFLATAMGEVEIDGVRRTITEAINAGLATPSSSVSGAHEMDMKPGGRYRMELGGLTILGKVVAKGRKVTGAPRRDPVMIASFSGSAVFMVGLIAAMRFATADGGDFLSQGNEEDRLNDLRNIVQRQQERQQPPPEPENNQQSTEEAGGTGTAHAGESGKMGKRDSTQTNRRYAIKNNGEPPHLAREVMQQRAQTAGILSAFGPSMGGPGGASGITSPWGQATESGVDNVNANGNMHGGEIGEALGNGGLGAVGTGWGGGGNGLGTIGMGTSGMMGHGSGTGSGDGIGGGTAGNLRDRGVPRPSVRPAAPNVSGGLTPEAIRRVVRSNIGQVEHCHSLGLTQNPTLQGRVVVSFAIGPDGRVMGSSLGSSSVSVPAVTSCIVAAVRRWHFQQPEGGVVVRVSYPFDLRVD